MRERRLGHVETVSPDEAPNVSAKGSLTMLDDHLIFADIESPHAIRNLRENPKTEINVVDPFVRKGYRFRGSGIVLRSGAVYWNALDRYKGEGADVRRIRAMVLVEVEQAAPLVSPVYLLGLDETDVRALWEEYHVKRPGKLVVDLIPPNDF